MMDQVTISHFKSLFVAMTNGNTPLLLQLGVVNIVLLVLITYARMTRKRHKNEITRRSSLPMVVFIANAVTILGVFTPLFKSLFSQLA